MVVFFTPFFFAILERCYGGLEAYLGLYQRSVMEFFAKIVNGVSRFRKCHH